VFAKPKDEQEYDVFFYSMMFLVIAGGSAITIFFKVCYSIVVCFRLSKPCSFMPKPMPEQIRFQFL